MKSSHVAAFLIALLVGGLFALSLFTMRGMQKLEAAPLVRKAIEEPKRGEEFARRAGEALNGDGASGVALARWLVGQGRPKLAVALMQPITTAKEGKDDPLAWAGLAWAAAQSGDEPLHRSASEQAKAKAEATMTRVNRAKPGDTTALHQFQNTGTYYSERQLGNDPAKAITALRETLRLTPTNDDKLQAQALNALGYTLADRGETPREFDEAVTLTQQALQKAPGTPMIMDSYGWALYKQGKNLPVARRILREAVDLALTEPDIRYHLAAVCAKLNLKDEAQVELERVLKLAPGHAEAESLKAELEQPRLEASPKAKS